MNFDVRSSKIVPFGVSEREVRDNFLDFVIAGDNSPIDVARYANIISIKREFYPVRCFHVSYSARWEATSIWEHREQYTEYTSKTVFIDCDGKEHDHSGYDHFYKGHYTGQGNIRGGRPWKPIAKTVPVEKSRKVIDNIERTSGDIGRRKSFQPIVIYADGCEKFGKWLLSIFKYGNQAYNETLIEGCEVKELLSSDASARKIAESNISNLAKKQCAAEVPGDRYEDLRYSVYDARYSMEVVLFPVFHIAYEYQNQEYECWAIGDHSYKHQDQDFEWEIMGERKAAFFCNDKPQDASLIAESEQIAGELKTRKKTRRRFGLLVFLALPIALLILFVCFFAGEAKMIYVLAVVGAGAFFINKFHNTNKEVKETKEFSANRIDVLTKKKEAIVSIVKRQDMSEAEKDQAIRGILH